MGAKVTLRWADEQDFSALGEVMHDAVRNGPSRYSEEQRRAWAPEPRKGEDWDARLSPQSIILAEIDGRIAGFMSLDDKGYLDFAYIRPAHQGGGLFRRLYARIEELARAENHPRILTHASLMAQPAFSKVGFDILRKESVEIGDQVFERFEMEKSLQ